MALLYRARESWPEFASYEEDKENSDEKYTERYKEERPIFWDMTNIHLPKPSDAQLQRLTFSSYYNENCLKGGIGLQTLGWIRTHDLWTGCASDTCYQAQSGIFEIQKGFAELDLVDGKKKPFTNIFDKGYRNRLVAWLAGEQLTLQPSFASSDRKFRRAETLSSAVIASDRSGNERAVRLTKMAGYINQGLHHRQSMERLDMAWKCWGFQINFMFNAVM